MSKVSDAALDKAFGTDVNLTYKLLRMVNSAATGARGIESIGHAVRLLGRAPLPKPVGSPPTLVVGSPDDRVVRRSALDRAAARYGGAPLLFPGMGHDLMLEPGWTEPVDAILDWLGKQI